VFAVVRTQQRALLFPYATLFRAAELLEHRGARRGRAEAVDRNRLAGITDPTTPAEGDARLDREPRARLGRQYLVAIGLRLRFERSEEHTSELQSRENLVCRLPLE